MKKNTFLKLFTISLLSLFFAAKPGIVDAQNLVADGSFDNSGVNWNFFAPATTVEAYLPELAYGGVSITNIVAEVDGGANLRQTNISVVPGQTYWLSFRYVRRSGAGVPLPAPLSFKIYDATATYLTDAISATQTFWDWQCKTYQFTPASNSIKIDFWAPNNLSTLGVIVDDITITPVNQIISLNGSGCQGSSVTLSAPATSDSNAIYTNYSWTGPSGFTSSAASFNLNNLSVANTGDYVCTMNLNKSLDVTGTFHLEVIPHDFYLTKEICEGESFKFYGRNLYTSGLYDTLIVSHNNGCDSFISLQLIVSPQPNVDVLPEGQITICQGDTIVFKITDPSIGANYQWFDQNGPIPGENSDRYKASVKGVYRLAGISSRGCVQTSSVIHLNVNLLPQATIKIDGEQNPCISDTITLTAGPDNAYSYHWSPEAVFRNTGSTETKEAKAILSNGQTNVVLTAFDIFGCHNADSLTIDARSCCRLFLPDAFTPNGDGLNEYFLPQINRGQIIVAMRVFDRWGKLVYMADGSSAKKGWDGNYTNGKPGAAGVYMYSIEYTCGERENEYKKGNVTLLR